MNEGREGESEGRGGREGWTYLLSLLLQALGQALLLSDLDLLHQQLQLAQSLHRSEGGREGGRKRGRKGGREGGR